MMQWLKEEMCEREVMGSNPMGRKDAKNSELGQQVQKNLLFFRFFYFYLCQTWEGGLPCVQHWHTARQTLLSNRLPSSVTFFFTVCQD